MTIQRVNEISNRLSRWNAVENDKSGTWDQGLGIREQMKDRN